MQRRPQGFFSRVYALVSRVPPGSVVTYSQIARALGAPTASRTVGWALRDCPSDIPWHRVVNAAGRISVRSTGGHRWQRRRLEKEGVRFNRTGHIDLNRFGWRKI